jgi:hypothetical protein
MNAERLHVIARALLDELEDDGVLGALQSLVTACLQIAQNPGNASIQQNFVNARVKFLDTVTDTSSDSFPLTWKQVVSDLGGQELFGKRLKERIEEIIRENQATLAVAHTKLNAILTELQKFHQALSWLNQAFAVLNIGFEELSPGEAEVAVLIPRSAVNDELGEFIDELDATRFILNTFSELVTGKVDELKVSEIASSEFMVYVGLIPIIGSAVAIAVNFVVEQYKKILEIKKLHLELERLQAPRDISEKTQEWANTQMQEAIAGFAKELLSQYKTVTDEGRRNELSNKIVVALDRIATRIDRGFSFEVRAAMPPKPEADKEVTTAVETIQAVSVNLQFIKLGGPPILSLPESTDEEKGEEEKPKKRSRKPKTEGDR